MNKLFLGVCGLLLSAMTFAAESHCYQLSESAVAWSKTPEVLCVNQVSQTKYALTLETHEILNVQTVAQLDYDLIARAKCINCNQDLFGITNPSNSVFNKLQVKFNGTGPKSAETGTVTIGSTVFHYRSIK